MVQYQQAIANVFRMHKDVLALMSTVGGTSASTLGGPNYGELVVHLKPRSERKLLVNDIIADLRPQLSNFPGMEVYMQNPPTIRIGGQVSKSLYQFSMQSPDRPELYAAVRSLLKALSHEPGLEDLTSDLEIASPQVNVEIDRDKAAALGVTASAIEGAFYDAYGTKWVSTIYGTITEHKGLLELEPKFQSDPEALSLLYFKATPAQGTPASMQNSGNASGGASAPGGTGVTGGAG